MTSRIATGARPKSASRRERGVSVVDISASIVVASAVAWNPWGLVGRHEIRLLICWTALAVGIRGVIRLRQIQVPAIWPLAVAFMAVSSVSALLARDWWTTILGHADRHLGLIGWVSLGAAVVVGANVTRHGQRFIRRVLEAAAVVVGLFVLGQTMLPGIFTGVAAGGPRPTSTFGSATYTAAFLSLALPFFLDGATRAIRSRDRTISLIGTGIVLAALISTGSRGAWIGALVGATIVLWPAKGGSGRRSATIVVAAMIAVTGVVLVTSQDVLERIRSLASPTSGTAGGRLVLWRAALDAIGERPLFGWGPERTRVGLTRSLPENFEAEYWDEAVPDRVHNVFLDIAITVGIPGALMFLAGLVLVGVSIYRHRQEDADWYRSNVAFVAAVAAYLPHLFFNFIQLDVDLIWAVLIGCVVGTTSRTTRPPVVARAAVSTVATVATVAAVTFGAGLVLADTYALRGVKQERSGDIAQAEQSYSSAVSFSVGDARYEEILMRFQRRQGRQAEAIATADRAAARHIGDPFFGELAGLTRAEAGVQSPALAEEALDIYADLIEHWPFHGSFYSGVGAAHASLGQYDQAEAAFVRAIELAPANAEAYRNLALLYFQLGRVEDSLRVVDSGLQRLGPIEALEILRNELQDGQES